MLSESLRAKVFFLMNINQLLRYKGLLGYIDGSVQKPGPETVPLPSTMPEGTVMSAQPQATTTSTPIYSSTPILGKWIFRDQLVRGHLTLNCTDVTSLGVITGGTAKEAWDSIHQEWGKSTDMHRSHAQEALNKTIYVEGMNIQDHVKLLHTRKAAVDNISTSGMSDEAWRGIII
jgi:hypothetical protein